LADKPCFLGRFLNKEEIMTFDIAIDRSLIAVAAAFGLSLMMAGPALADGGGGGSSDKTTCPAGEVYDARSMSCVKQGSQVLPDKVLTDYAYALAKAWRYDEALDVLNQLKNPNTPEALNYRGYVTRKMGRIDEGIAYYHKSIALDPRYAKVREYLGEAYVIKHDTARAKDQLRAIKSICGTDCEEYQKLATAIAEGVPS
jgi:tetratricopeptide (TPR) repeat protein